MVGGDVFFPYQGCQLIDLSGFLNISVNTGQIKQSGPDVPFVSGARTCMESWGGWRGG